MLTWTFALQAQSFNNEWIDYNKTYYKFFVGANGLYRIDQSVLAGLGIGSAPAEHFQLWRNGEQVPMHTSVPSGPLSPSDYLEFWGEMNDGKPDKIMYRLADHQLSDKWSLETDTAAYFLTVNPSGNNLRLVNTPNNLVAGATPEPFFYHTQGIYFKQRINPGYAAIVGSAIYSSNYDQGEGWTSTDIGRNVVRTENFTSLFPYTGSGANTPTLQVVATGNALNPRTFSTKINGTQYDLATMDYFDYVRRLLAFPITAIASGSASVQITNLAAVTDRMALAQLELSYPRLFNFGGANQFSFQLMSGAGTYLEIAGFNHGGVAPVLYDFTNGQRYVCDIATPGVVRVQLLSAAGVRKLQLVSMATGQVQSVTALATRNFVNYGLAVNQGDYLMITHPSLLVNVGSSSPVEDYRAYRSTTLGGGHKAKVYMIDQLIDQFAFGIRLHPLSVRNFIRFARNTYADPVKNVLLIGKGVEYVANRSNLSNPDLNLLSLVPTFGTPASDMLLAADPGLDVRPKVSIGRISVINAQEVKDYFEKVVQYEQQQLFYSPLIRDKAWTKNVVHVNGSGDGSLGEMLASSFVGFKRIITDSMYGAKVYDFTKLSSAPIEQVSSLRLYNLFEEGIGMLTYFGHSSATTLEFNLDNPTNYNNPGKYPMISLLGCNAGNFFTFNSIRLQSKETISEKFVLTRERGGISVMASSGLGIVNYLDIYHGSLLHAASVTNYGRSMGEIIQEGIRQVYNLTTQEDYFARVTCEQTSLHGDPALSMNASAPKPDYAIEPSYLKISPTFISIAEASFQVQAVLHNLGKAMPNRIVVEVKRTYPNQSSSVIIRDTIDGIRFTDTLVYQIPIVAGRDKGQNRIEFCIDPYNAVEEMFESNNCASQDFVIFEDEARPVFPVDFSIVSASSIRLTASTANPLAISRQYRMEIDTTTLFNSPLKNSQTITTSGGLLEFLPGVNFQDSVVYYWRVAPVPTSGTPNWNVSSFVYRSNAPSGFQQSHFYQHTKSDFNKIKLDSADRSFRYTTGPRQFFAQNGIFPNASNQGGYYYAAIDNRIIGGAGCGYNELIFNVIHPYTLRPWLNNGGAGGQYGSGSNCGGLNREYNFRFPLGTALSRKAAMDFIDLIPAGFLVVVRTNASAVVTANTYAGQWMADTSTLGSGNSLYHKLKNQGFAEVDSFNAPKAFNLFFSKNNQSNFPTRWGFSPNIFEGYSTTAVFSSPDTTGSYSSPWFGPMKSWTEAYWDGKVLETGNPTERFVFSVIGFNPTTQSQDTLFTNLTQPGTIDISSIQAGTYPYLRLSIKSTDTSRATPWNLRAWRVAGVPTPEGGIAPNLAWQFTDTVFQGQPHQSQVAFKNISSYPFDSVLVKRWVIDRNNLRHDIPTPRRKPILTGDTLLFSTTIDTRPLPGSNQFWISVNPDQDQPEQYSFNNLLTRSFHVKPDSIAPLLDVTFDGIHILDNDVVSPEPLIKIRLRDQSNWMVLSDTSVMQVQVRFPNGQLRRFYFSGDTLKFYPPTGAAPVANNEATADFLPLFNQDGTYELIVQAKDLSGNQSGRLNYRTNFQVVNASQVSELLNYPNPFSTSTAFAFTLTGREVPDQFKIEILTITGRVIREVTSTELGPLRIGRNITAFKWDGTDQYGQAVANGVYLFRAVVSKKGIRVETNPTLNPSSQSISTKGYGKMYLMR
jgi:hypothetical protein